MNCIRIIIITGLFSFISCQPEPEKVVNVITRATDADFAEANQVAPTIADGFQMDLWAPGPLLSNAVALTFDNQGVAYVSETARRKSSDIDIRAHRDWRIGDLSLQTIEDTRQFHLDKLATSLSEQNTWQEDFNKDGFHDYRDLTIQTEYIRRVWDSDGDGKADISHLFAEGFNDMLTGVAAGILYQDGAIYLTAAPNVYQLTDTNDDGLADKRKIISHGYGIHIAYAGHDMSGLTMGMDGRIYWSIGDMGVNAVGPDGKRWAYPNQGAVMRCNPDGSDFEVFAHGLRNPQELAFDNFGNLISVDNDGDHAGEHERYVHIIEGSDTGWRINWQYGKYDEPNESYKVWMDEKLYLPHFAGQAAYLLPAIKLAYDGPVGLAFNPGTAFNSEWKDYFFASYFKGSSARSKIQAFQIQPKGASFEIINEKDIIGGIVPTGITFAPDGALYVNDWKDSYAKKPAGRIWKLDTKNKIQAIRKATQTLLKEGFINKTRSELAELLAHPDQRIRLGAQFELVKKEEVKTLAAIAKNDQHLLARLHAIWGIGQLARINAKQIEVLLPLFQDKEAEIRAQTAKVIGDAKYSAAAGAMLQQLNDTSPRAQFFAVEALGKIESTQAFQPLVNLLEKIEESDPHFRHAVVLALSRLNSRTKLTELSTHPSKFVRIGAVVALRMLAAPEVAEFLGDKDELVLTEAARAINDDLSIPAALPVLAKSLEKIGTTNEAFLRRAINANLRVGDAESAKRLTNFAKNNTAPIDMRKDALWALGYWENPPVLDRVDGRYRKLSGQHKLADATNAMAESFTALTAVNDLKIATITAAGRIKYKAAGSTIFSIFKQEKKDIAIKSSALAALADLESEDLATAIDLALVDKNIAMRQTAQTLLEKVNLPSTTLVNLLEKILIHNAIPEKQKALTNLGNINTPEAANLLKQWLDKLVNKNLDSALQLDVLTAIDNSTFDHLKKEKLAFENSLPTETPAAKFAMTLFGGNPKVGKTIFNKNESAQCLRCHAIRGKGGEVGPPLDNIANKLDRKALLLSLVEPNARIAPGYGTIILKLKDGQEIAGILTQETDDSITVKVGKEAPQTYSKRNIATKEVLPSGMFNIGDLLTKIQIRDLMAYLGTLKNAK